MLDHSEGFQRAKIAEEEQSSRVALMCEMAAKKPSVRLYNVQKLLQNLGSSAPNSSATVSSTGTAATLSTHTHANSRSQTPPGPGGASAARQLTNVVTMCSQVARNQARATTGAGLGILIRTEQSARELLERQEDGERNEMTTKFHLHTLSATREFINSTLLPRPLQQLGLHMDALQVPMEIQSQPGNTSPRDLHLLLADKNSGTSPKSGIGSATGSVRASPYSPVRRPSTTTMPGRPGAGTSPSHATQSPPSSPPALPESILQLHFDICAPHRSLAQLSVLCDKLENMLGKPDSINTSSMSGTGQQRVSLGYRASQCTKPVVRIFQWIRVTPEVLQELEVSSVHLPDGSHYDIAGGSPRRMNTLPMSRIVSSQDDALPAQHTTLARGRPQQSPRTSPLRGSSPPSVSERSRTTTKNSVPSTSSSSSSSATASLSSPSVTLHSTSTTISEATTSTSTKSTSPAITASYKEHIGFLTNPSTSSSMTTSSSIGGSCSSVSGGPRAPSGSMTVVEDEEVIRNGSPPKHCFRTTQFESVQAEPVSILDVDSKSEVNGLPINVGAQQQFSLTPLNESVPKGELHSVPPPHSPSAKNHSPEPEHDGLLTSMPLGAGICKTPFDVLLKPSQTHFSETTNTKQQTTWNSFGLDDCTPTTLCL
eukprot:TRINITY_DN54261_c0_g1_i1.p1 TRINITY_DN54261_c0_g1~~TRINITY_DN54261_c0_g1_i1.p1  ORF type:complete len:703 (+),score=78.39 TRINITY_DN54261_c0_g1_i1:149-2110(+)